MAPTSSASVFSSSLFNSSSVSVARPTTRDSTLDPQNQAAGSSAGTSGTPAVKERKTGFSRKASRRGTWTGAASHGGGGGGAANNAANHAAANNNNNTNSNSNSAVTDASSPPALPEYALAAAAKVVIREKDKIKEKLREREKEKEQEKREKEQEKREKEQGKREREQEKREKEKSREREKDRDRDKRRETRERERERDIRPRDTLIAGHGHSLAAADAAHAPGSPKEAHNFVIARLHAAAMGTPGPGYGPGANASSLTVGGSAWESSMHMESSLVFHEITELAQKRISTLTYLRKAHEGRIYWFNTYLFDRPDYSRMPSFDPRKLGRKATSYFLLGISIPTINDLYSSTPVEFLRCLNGLLAEFDTFTQLHGDGPPSAASLTRARLPSMFRRPVAKTRRSGSTSAASDNIIEEGTAGFGSSSTSLTSRGDRDSRDRDSRDRDGGGGGGGGGSGQGGVMNFATAESELLPGEEYAYLLTPSLPFDPDFYETFATLCDVLIDCYSRFLALIPTQWDATPHIAELFTKADGKMRKIMVQGIVRDFEEHSRTNVKSEMAGISKVVLAGLV